MDYLYVGLAFVAGSGLTILYFKFVAKARAVIAAAEAAAK